MIKCPECRHHISSMAKACPECGAPIDPVWAEEEAQRELKKLEEVPFTVEGLTEDDLNPNVNENEDETLRYEDSPSQTEEPMPETEGQTTPLPNMSPSPFGEGLGVRPEGQGGESVGSSWGKYFILVAILALLIGAFYYYDYRGEKQREERAYELLQGCSNPDFYEDFIVRFPKSKRIEEVRARYDEVKQQQSQWQTLIADGTRDDLQRFVREYPTSPYVKVAQARLDSLDWADARKARTLESVNQYIAQHPEGYYVDQADALRTTLERAKAEAEAAAAALRDSLAQAGQAE